MATVAAVILHLGLLFIADHRTSHQWIIDPMTTTHAAGLTWTDTHSSTFSPNVFGVSGAFGPADLTQSNTALLEPSYWATLGQGDPQWSGPGVLPTNFGSGPAEVPSLTRELVILDREVPQWEQLRDDFLAQRAGGRAIDVVVLAAGGDGVRQISQALAGYRNLQSLHIFSHGQAGALQLGGEWLHDGNLSLYANDLLAWGDSLADGADLLLYGCDVAAGLRGQQFVDGLAVLVGADVAASNDLTGHSGLGGNWGFEYIVGQIETGLALSSVAQEDWFGLLSQTINIDNNWLNANGGGNGPYYLDQAGATYVLQTDVTTPGTAFVIIANNITFDLNGYTVTYDNAAPTPVPNGNFEQGANGIASGWDFSNAANASRFNGVWLENQTYDGDHSLRFSLPGGDQYVQSFSAVTLDANTTYSLSSMFWRDNLPGVTLYVDLIGQNGEETQRLSYATGNTRGIQFKEHVFTTGNSAGSYFVRIGVEGAANVSEAAVFVDDVKIQRTRVYGVANGAFSWAASEFPGVTQFGQADNTTIKNGSILQGQNGSTWSHNIYARRGYGLHVDQITAVVHGANGSNVSFVAGDNGRITNNHFTSNVLTVTSRDQFHGSMIGNNFIGEISGNTLENGPHTGIRVSSAAKSVIFNNTIRMKNRYTNGFAIHAHGPGTEVYQNTIDQGAGEFSGRGIFMSETATETVRIYDNWISVQALRNNQEYKGAVLGGAYAIQFDHGSNVEIFGNTVIANAYEADASALRVNNGSRDLRIYLNTFQAIRYGANLAANAIKIADDSFEHNNRFEDNTLITNHAWIGESRATTGTVLERTRFKIVGDVVDDRWFETDNWSHNANGAVVGLRLVDSTYDSEAVRTAIESGRFRRLRRTHNDGFSSYVVAWSTEFNVLDANGNSLASAEIRVVNGLGQTVFEGATDEAGRARIVLDEFRSQGISLSEFQKINFNGYSVVVTHGGNEKSLEFNADRVQSLNVQFDGDSSPRFEYDGFRLVVFGNDNANTFTWNAGNPLSLLIDNVNYLINPGITEFVFHGLAGMDRLNLTGSSLNDHFVLGLGNATLTTGTGLILRAFGFEEVFAAAGGGTLNQVFLSDSAGDDHFTASAGLATMVGSGFHHQVTGFQRVTANRSTGNDVATLYDSAGDDVFLSHFAFSSMTGSGFVSRANGFATVVAHATNGGFNQAFLHDSNGDDLFAVSPTVASMSGPGFSHQAHGFQRVTANRSGGNDVAHFYGSAGNDILLSRRDFTSLTAGFFIGRANAFDTVVTFGGQGGHDQAFMHDTPGVDLFTATLGLATMTGTGYHHEVRDFHRVMAFRSSGNDAAHFHGSAFNDTFLTYPQFSSMISGSFVNRADGFTSVVGFGGAAGFDQAFMYDSAGDDLFSATDGLATMTGPGFQHEARGFQRVTAHRTTGNDVAHFFDSPGNDTFLTRREFSSLISATGTNRANWFPTVVAFGGAGGVDTARFYSSAESDTFRGGFADLTMAGNGYSTRTESFGRVHLHGIPGGVVDDFRLDLDGATEVTLRPQLGVFRRGTQLIEALDFAQMTVRRVGTAVSAEAQLWAGAGDDVFEGRADFALMSGSGYQNRAENFAATTGRAGGVNNAAYLYGGSQDNHLVGDLLVPRLWGAGYSHTLRDFRQIFVQAGVGGQNRLNLGDSPGDDVVTVGAGWAQLVGSGVTLEAQGFTNQIVRSERGGVDTVYLLSTGSSNLAGMYENFTWLTNQANSYYLRANNFAVVEVQHTGGGGNNRVNLFAPVDGAAQTLTFAGNMGQVDHGPFRRRFSGFDFATVQYRGESDNLSNEGTNYRLSLIDLS